MIGHKNNRTKGTNNAPTPEDNEQYCFRMPLKLEVHKRYCCTLDFRYLMNLTYVACSIFLFVVKVHIKCFSSVRLVSIRHMPWNSQDWGIPNGRPQAIYSVPHISKRYLYQGMCFSKTRPFLKGQMNRNFDVSFLFFAQLFIKNQINISRSFKVIGHCIAEILQVE